MEGKRGSCQRGVVNRVDKKYLPFRNYLDGCFASNRMAFNASGSPGSSWLPAGNLLVLSMNAKIVAFWLMLSWPGRSAGIEDYLSIKYLCMAGVNSQSTR